MAHNADSFAKEGKGKNNHHRYQPRDVAVTSGVGAVAYRLRMKYQRHELRGDEQTARAVKEGS
jgi:hypothetical protein